MTSDETFYSDGLKFACAGCGRCCTFRGGHRYVYVTLEDRRALAGCLGMSLRTLTRRYTVETGGWRHLRIAGAHCPFLVDQRCSVYAARPVQCRSWPFWPENMNRQTWEGEIAATCPGIGRGRRWTAKTIAGLLRADPLAVRAATGGASAKG